MDNKDPGLSDRIHCLVSIIPADGTLWCVDGDNISDHAMRKKDKAFIQKIKDVRAHASTMGIPQIVVLSKVDKACPEVNKDIKKIYSSKTIREKITHCSDNVGVPEYCIFPVKNYHEEIDLNNDMDMLLLSALRRILNLANDHAASIKEADRRISNNFAGGEMSESEADRNDSMRRNSRDSMSIGIDFRDWDKKQ